MYINLGIIGNPLEHTLSPLIHNYFFYKTGLCGGYTCYHIELEDIPDILDIFLAYKFTGINVTVPYKKEIIKYCDNLDITADSIGAVNTLHFTDNGITGHNTDIFGFHMMMAENNVTTNNKRVLLLGAGGASRAVLPYLQMNEPYNLVISNRTMEKAEELAYLYGGSAEICMLDELYDSEFDIVINTTSIGLKGEQFKDYGFIVKEAAVDMVYKPQLTSFLSLYKQSNIKLINGLSMLIYQAAGSFNIWTKQEVVPDMSYFHNIVYK